MSKNWEMTPECGSALSGAASTVLRSASMVFGSAAVRPLLGELRVASDKSLSHRVVMFSAMASGSSQVSGLLDCEDVRATIEIVKRLGAKLNLDADKTGLFGSISGWGETGPADVAFAHRSAFARQAVALPTLDCGNSGTTARLMLGLLGGYPLKVTLTGDNSLRKRPMRRVIEPLSLMGVGFESGDEPAAGSVFSAPTHLPITVIGSEHLRAIDYISPVASAQLKSAVLLAGLHAQGITTVREPHKSRDHTEHLLAAYGAKLAIDGLQVSIAGGQKLHATNCAVPADPSSAAFFLVAAAMTQGSDLVCRDVLLNPTRTGFIRVMQDMGARLEIALQPSRGLGDEEVGDIRCRHRSNLKATRVRAHEIASLIDEIPILALLATQAKGETVFEQVAELRVKESNRLRAVIDGLVALGIKAWEQDDDLHVVGGKAQMSSACFETFGDHRLAMMWTIAERVFGFKLNISQTECVKVSYPTFFRDLGGLS